MCHGLVTFILPSAACMGRYTFFLLLFICVKKRESIPIILYRKKKYKSNQNRRWGWGPKGEKQ